MFKNGTYENHCNTHRYKRLRISAGPQRGQYVDVLILEAKLGRKLGEGMTVDHRDGNSLNVDPENLREMTQGDNTALANKRRYGYKKRLTQEAQSV